MPCTRDSPRVCECRPGMFCVTTATNSCARCASHSTCSMGMIVKLQGTAERDTVCELAPRKTHPGCSTSSEDYKGFDCLAYLNVFSRNTTTEATSNLSQVHTPEDTFKERLPHSPSSPGKPSPDPGLSSQKPCPEGSADCGKQCGPDYYLDKAGRCTACVSCLRDDLVEKTLCTRNSPRVCECRPGMVCATSATNSCARCVTSHICPSKMAKAQGTARRDTAHESPPSGSPSDCSSSPEESNMSASTTSTVPSSPLDSHTNDNHEESTIHAQQDTSIPTSASRALFSTRKPVLTTGSVLFWVTIVLVAILVSSTFLLCHWKACGKGIRQKLHLCFQGQTFRPKPAPVDSRSQKLPKPCRSILVTETDSEEKRLMSTPSVEACPSVGTPCLESLKLLGASPPEGPSSPREVYEPLATAEHTNNKIENIYIMKADTVIVGSVRTEVPESQGVATQEALNLEEDLEVDHIPHYPEQETEPPLGSCGDVMFSVEEEGKEEPVPTTASEK
ncbi:PREDICTED: tumor necrosis factor receptor superfamily member 8 [Elephantulus edwardii]|uniref:tumor necrosis factor receptor superfamily member 8 n=1 Tax=Elephantulus edwardii TaxID=28737 RepID=UPI0003F07D4A|nr:PREDICTED: tumor necrosis factor receptor superfamily member 8 [Elephantulus edwardii]